ncbi:hypothetical protein [Clostridium beijerinckii]|uniref:hypothetical protein n=1 Tax=Clostridium beijerinckii TaxID=1520 RepID=UPI00156FC501|nr:hypothetical protein [Clostridium beijerinckii]NRT72065.1 hypothetical protein [Clostridium beijerinckii]
MNSESEHMEYKLRMKRAEIYNSIKIELEKNKYYMPTIVRRINSLRRNELSKPLDGILNDICFLLETLDYLSYSCECEKITGNNFFSYTTFYRISILHMRNILFDINKFIKQNKLQDKVLIKNYLDKIMKFSEEIISYRNDLEHNIDPFFDGKMDELQQSITVSNIILYLKLIIKLIHIIILEKLKIKK